MFKLARACIDFKMGGRLGKNQLIETLSYWTREIAQKNYSRT